MVNALFDNIAGKHKRVGLERITLLYQVMFEMKIIGKIITDVIERDINVIMKRKTPIQFSSFQWSSS